MPAYVYSSTYLVTSKGQKNEQKTRNKRTIKQTKPNQTKPNQTKKNTNNSLYRSEREYNPRSDSNTNIKRRYIPDQHWRKITYGVLTTVRT